MKVNSESEVAQSCPTFSDPKMDCILGNGLQPTRLLCPWDFPGKSTGVGCHCSADTDTHVTESEGGRMNTTPKPRPDTKSLKCQAEKCRLDFSCLLFQLVGDSKIYIFRSFQDDSY